MKMMTSPRANSFCPKSWYLVEDGKQDITQFREANVTTYYITTQEWKEEPPHEFVKWVDQVLEKFAYKSNGIQPHFYERDVKLIRVAAHGVPRLAGLRRISMEEIYRLQAEAHAEYNATEQYEEPVDW